MDVPRSSSWLHQTCIPGSEMDTLIHRQRGSTVPATSTQLPVSDVSSPAPVQQLHSWKGLRLHTQHLTSANQFGAVDSQMIGGVLAKTGTCTRSQPVKHDVLTKLPILLQPQTYQILAQPYQTRKRAHFANKCCRCCVTPAFKSAQHAAQLPPHTSAA